MEKEKLKHIVIDLALVWLFLILSFAFAIWQKIISICIFGAIIVVWYFIKTLRWILFAYDKLFDKTVVVETKGYRFFKREPIYFFSDRSKWHYSEIVFDDPMLKGKYILLEDVFFMKHGELLEVTYYKSSKVIKSIKRL